MSRTHRTDDARKLEYYSAGYWRSEDLWTSILRVGADRPDKPALICDGRSITFGDLMKDAEHLARGLRAQGLRRGDVVLIHGRNSVESVTTLLACTWLGTVMAGIPPMFSAAQVKSIAESAKARAVIGLGDAKEVERAIRGARDAHTVTLIAAPDGFAKASEIVPWTRLIENDDESERALIDPDALALLAYSSGTTGAPKGVMHSSNTVRYAIEQRAALHAVDDQDICIVVSQFGFVGNVVFGSLSGPLIGATSVLMRHWNPEHALELIESNHVSYGLFLPTHVFDLLDAPRLDRTDLSHFERAAMGGLSRQRRIEVRRRLGLIPLPGYGMSECIGNSTCTIDDADEKLLTREGRPYPGTLIRVVDEDGGDLVAGETGRVLVDGPSRCLGYYNAAEMTQAAMTPDGYFRTGDLGFLDEDGYFAFVGREKDVIRRGGVTIVPGEVEAALMEHPRIDRVAVVAMPDERLGERACACVITTDGRRMTLEEVTGFLEARAIARYLWPERVETFTEFPHTPSLKVKKPELVSMLLAAAEVPRRE